METTVLKPPVHHVNFKKELHDIYRSRLPKFLRSLGYYPDDLPKLIATKRIIEREDDKIDCIQFDLIFITDSGDEIGIVTAIFETHYEEKYRTNTIPACH